jgi:signal transduction histidine kinase
MVWWRMSDRAEEGAAEKRRDEERGLIAALAEANQALRRSNSELEQFAYVVSHDLKAPLRGIANLSQWIEEDLGDSVPPEVRKNLDLLRGRVRRLEALIEGILVYSRAGRVRERAERVDVAELLRETIELLGAPAGTTITVGDGMPVIVVERAPFQQVFLNLVGNAVKFAPKPGAVVRVEVREEERAHHFTVTDNGPGIAPEHHGRIWGIFQTLQSRDQIEGTGIGLSVVKRIVESRGGSTWVESEPGKGATFHVRWPREAGDETRSRG